MQCTSGALEAFHHLVYVAPFDGVLNAASKEGELAARAAFWIVLPVSPDSIVDPLSYQVESGKAVNAYAGVFAFCESGNNHWLTAEILGDQRTT